jgi:LysM repeat protein
VHRGVSSKFARVAENKSISHAHSTMNFPWKQQKIITRGPVANYSHLRQPLPNPPKGKVWTEDKETREWKLVNCSVEEPELVMDRIVENIPTDAQNNIYEEWEILSDRQLSQNSAPLMVAKAGSVRSLSSMEHGEHNSSNAAISLPFKIQRTTSNSTIDSCDNALGPSGKGILGVDYVEHVVLPSDTLQGICLAYKVNVTRLRQANCFSGNSISLAPKKLVIPLSKQALRSGCIRVQDTDAKEYKLHAFLAEFPDLSIMEAKAYVASA